MSLLVVATICIVSVVITSFLSGIAGMAGGFILIVILVLIVPLTSAMILHGAVQAVANGSRVWFLREHIVWFVLPPYCLGAALVLITFYIFQFVTEPAMVMILVGSFPWVAKLIPQRIPLDITKPIVACVAGGAITLTQLLAGASGPILDVFYQATSLNRFQIVSSKALTQTIGHLLKIVYFVSAANWMADGHHTLVSWWFIPILLVASIVSTRLGTQLLHRIDESRFRTATSWLILGIGTIVMLGGIYQYVGRLQG